MIPELGQLALLLALAVALVQGTLPLAGARAARPTGWRWRGPAAQTQCLLVAARRSCA